MTRRHVVVMLTTSYPRFPGDTVGTFMEPIARGVAARGHEVHMVLPDHPSLQRRGVEDGVHFHPFRYAPVPALNVFGYTAALRADTHLRWSAWLAAPLALAASFLAVRRVAREVGATIIHGHWLVPGGAVATAAGRLPTVISLHGSDVYVAERHVAARRVARRALRRVDWMTACSDDLRERALVLGAPPDRIVTVPYGVDTARFRPDAAARERVRSSLGLARDDVVLFTAGRFVKKKGFEFLIDAVAELAPRWPGLKLVLAGGGDLDADLKARVRARHVTDRVRFPGLLPQPEVAAHLAAADISVVPSVHDEHGNVDGLPNTVMESLASGTPLVASEVAGIPAVVTHNRTGLLVPEQDVPALAAALDRLIAAPDLRAALGRAARDETIRLRGWDQVAATFEDVYDRAADRFRP